jgi:Cys-rich four helix bundle protein (predicted Tat secretion target)
MKEFTRRDLLKGAIAVSAATMISSTAQASSNHHHHSNPNAGLVDTALDCLKTGQACLDHCFALFKQGDTSVADCADKVTEMLAMCTALSQMASYQSKHLASLAKLCAAVCKDCKKECDKHAKKHAACKACAESCEKCIKECEKIAA